MAQEEVMYKVTFDSEGAVKTLEKVKEGVEDIGKSAEKTQKSTGLLAKGVKGVGLTFKNLAKASGIVFVLQKAFEVLTDVFKQNQKSVDLFNTAFEFVSIAFNDFVDFLFGNVGNVVQVFKDIFENPQKKIKELGSALYDGVVVRFNEMLEVFGLVGDAIGELFAGNFSEAAQIAKQAGKEVVDVVTGVDKSFDEVAEKVTNYTKEVYESAKANVELEKSSKIAQAQLQGVLEGYDRQAEILRQTRDDETKTFEERIAANEKLKEVLDEQEKAMLALAQVEVDRAQAQFDKLQNDENEIALIQAKNELAGIEAQITGFRSEQLTNQVALEKELGETKRQIAAEGVSERERELLEVEQQYEELFELARKSGQDTVELEKQKANKITEIKEAHAKEDAEIQKALRMSELDAANQSLENVKTIFGEETKAGKAAAVAQATISTYKAATSALDDAPVPFNFILAATTVAAGLANIQKILSVQPPEFAQGGIVGGFGTGTSDSITARLSKGEAVINERSTRMFKPLLSSINEAGGGRAFAGNEGSGGQTMGVVKAFVVADDMTNEQDKLTKIRRKATI